MRVIEIVRQHLIENGFDGLYLADAECACLVSDLQPCGDDFSVCKAGYRRDDPQSPGDWIISGTKPEPDNTTADLFAGQQGEA